MDIYDFIDSADVSAYCREIKKEWNTYEMAVIIGISDKSTEEKHTAWRELIENYPDMPTVPMHDVVFDSIHKKLAEIMENKCSFSDFFGFHSYIDIPTPFKRGDILKSLKPMKKNQEIFVLDELTLACNRPDLYERAMQGIWFDEGWCYFVDDVGVLYGDHIYEHYFFEYYNGKLENNLRLLHYVNLYLKDEIQLPALLNVQCRIVAEYMLNEHFLINAHGRSIPEDNLVENRFVLENNHK